MRRSTRTIGNSVTGGVAASSGEKGPGAGPAPQIKRTTGRGDGQRAAGGGAGRRHRAARGASHSPGLPAAPVRSCGAHDGPRRAAGRRCIEEWHAQSRRAACAPERWWEMRAPERASSSGCAKRLLSCCADGRPGRGPRRARGAAARGEMAAVHRGRGTAAGGDGVARGRQLR
jgi:hypothetical protein